MTAYRALGAKHPDAAVRNADRLAERFLGVEERRLLKEAGSDILLAALAMDTESAWARLGNRGVLARAVHVRTRHIDDVVEDSVKTGISQIVNLGAGLDSRAYRMLNRGSAPDHRRAFHARSRHVAGESETDGARCKQRIVFTSRPFPGRTESLELDFEDRARAGAQAPGEDHEYPLRSSARCAHQRVAPT
jgi:hypothetical protein